jgi:hypothetical protein
MIDWWQHLTFSESSAILLGMLAGFCLGGSLLGRRRQEPEYPVCSPRVSRAWLRALYRNSRSDL